MTKTTILSEDSVGLILQYAASMEFWEELQVVLVPIGKEEWDPERWDLEEDHWLFQIHNSYCMCLRLMGGRIGLVLDSHCLIGDLMGLLTGVAKWDKQIVKECYIAYIEQFKCAFQDTKPAKTFIDMTDWRNEYREDGSLGEEDICEEIWRLNDVDHNDWRGQAIEEAIAEAILRDVRRWPLSPWTIFHQKYVVVARHQPTIILRAFRTLHDAEEYALMESDYFPCLIYRGRCEEEPELVDSRWSSLRQLCY